MSEDDKKRVVKEAIQEWLDEQFLTFGKWSVAALAALAFAALVYFSLRQAGWLPPEPSVAVTPH